MGISDRVSETSWKWWCKSRNLVRSCDKTLADYSSESTLATDLNEPDSTVNVNDGSRDAKGSSLGSLASVKTFYEGPGSGCGHFRWVDYPPRQMSKSAAKAQDRVAIRLYKIKDDDKPIINGRVSLKYHAIEVQNPSLIAALKPILEDEDEHLDVGEVAKFNEPFRSLYFCYGKIAAKCKSLDEENPVKTFMLLFIRVLDEVFAEIRAKKRSLQASGLVSYETAWTFFARDAPVLCQGQNCEFICKVVDTAYIKTPTVAMMRLYAKRLRFNGDAYEWEDQDFIFPEFPGNKPITELPHYPLKFHNNVQAVRRRMEARGRMILDYQGLTYCSYNGIALHEVENGFEKHNVEGRILVDVIGYNKHYLMKGDREGKDAGAQKKTVKGTGRSALENLQKLHRQFYAVKNRVPDGEEVFYSDTENVVPAIQTTSTQSKRLSQEDQDKNKATMLAHPEDLMYMSPLLEGYALKNKLWVSFYVEDIRPIVWNKHAFQHLVYDEQQKDLVLSFVESHGRSSHQQLEDVILGKGQGLIILLSGPPGTGKTLTAEAVADSTKRPLFYLQAEDLGISPATLGANIKKVFEMATEWDAVILLDEADVFMAKRNPNDIQRNELVSIFLRELEYFRGIIFLTTNLYHNIDSAFRSRVSLHLLFKPLALEARMVVWRKFLGRLPGFQIGNEHQQHHHQHVISQELAGDLGCAVPEVIKLSEIELGEEDATATARIVISDDDIKELGKWQLNGREIKNAVKMVKSWCDHKGYDMTLERLENGIKATSPHASISSKSGDIDLYDD